MFGPCVDAFAFPPMSARSSWFFDPTAAAHPELPAELERRADRLSSVVRFDTKAGERSLDLLLWDLVPYWATGAKAGFSNINAKPEGIETAILPGGILPPALSRAGR
jgi:hypothetical protein